MVPRTEFPNFRDHAKTVRGPLLKLLINLQRRHGETFAAESGLRQMLCEDTKHMPGVGTVPHNLRKMEDEGIIWQEWLYGGGLKPDGEPCDFGMRLIRVAFNRQQRFAFAARAKARNRRQGVTRNVELRKATVEQARKHLASTVRDLDANERERAAQKKREEDLARARALGLYDSDRPEPKPPD